MQRKECNAVSGPSKQRGAVVATAALVILLAAGDARAGTIRVLAQCVVDQPQVTLGDVAQLRAFPDRAQESMLAELVLFDAPEPGTRAVYSAAEIREQLYAHAVNLAEVLLTGSARVQVTRPGDIEAPNGEPGNEPGAGAAAATGPPTLERAIRRFVRERLADMGGAADLQLSRTQAANKALALAGPEFDFRVRSSNVRRLGLVSFEVDILRGREQVQTLHILGELALRRSVVVAAKPINRGQVVSEEHVRLAERRFRRPEQLGETDPQQVRDKEARRFIDRGAMITARDVKTIPLVRRGDLVTVWNRSSGVSLKTVGKALGTGGLGEVIEVKSERSGRRYAARITGGRTVEAAPGAPGDAPG